MTSNSDSSTRQQDQKPIQLEVYSKPNSDFPIGCGISFSIDPENHREEEEEAKEIESTDSSSLDLVKKTLFSAAIEVPENDDGFKTPTDQMIPEITECPQAPKRDRKQETRKKRASPHSRRSLLVDFCPEEVESMFPPATQEDLSRGNKRARSEKTE